MIQKIKDMFNITPKQRVSIYPMEIIMFLIPNNIGSVQAFATTLNRKLLTAFND